MNLSDVLPNGVLGAEVVPAFHPWALKKFWHLMEVFFGFKKVYLLNTRLLISQVLVELRK